MDKALNSAFEYDIAGRQIVWEKYQEKYDRIPDTCCYK